MSIIAIVGPTAVGKSDLAVDLALRTGAEIISADSMQVYVGMDIGTAKMSVAERRGVPHHMIDVWHPCHEVSVVEFRDTAREALVEARERDRPVIVVGGSWLYVQAILDELEFPGTDPQVRAGLEAELVEQGPQALHDRLARLDPQAAEAILPSNGRRVVRALEVVALQGSFRARLPEPAPWRPATWIGVTLDRVLLDARITERVDRMWASGLVAEVRGLQAGGLGRTASRAIGYAQVLDAFARAADEMDQGLAEARRVTIDGTRSFARRQERRFRQDARVQWLGPDPAGWLQEALAVLGR